MQFFVCSLNSHLVCSFCCSWDYIQDGDSVVQDMDRTQAFAKGLHAWARWVDANLLQTTTKVFFQGYSPSHLQ